VHDLEVAVVVPHDDGIEGIIRAEIHLDPLRAFLEFDRIAIGGFFLAIGDLIEVTRERIDASGDRLAEGDIFDAFWEP